MEFQGILVSKVGQREGENSRGHWVVASFLLESEEMYPKHVVIDVSNTEFINRIGEWESHIGKRVNVRFEIDAREYEGRWFNSLKGYGIREVLTDAEKQHRQDAKTAEKKQPATRPSEIGMIETPTGKVNVNDDAGEVDWDNMGQTAPAAEEKKPEAVQDDLPFK